MNDALAESRTEIERLRRENRGLEHTVAELGRRNDWLMQVVFGQKSEKQPPVQDHGDGEQETLFGVPVTGVSSTDEIGDDHDQDDAPPQTTDERKGRGKGGKSPKPKNGGGRKPVNPDLREVIEIIPAAEDDKFAADGTPYVLLGYETTEREHLLPAELVRLLIKREKWGLPDTHETAFRAPVPPSIIPRGKYTDAIIHEAMIRKYLYGMPFERQVADFATLGSDLSVSTLCNLAQGFARFYQGVAQAIQTQVLEQAFVHIDETPIPVQNGPRRQLWAAYAGKQVFFHFGGRGAEDLRAVLGQSADEAGTHADPPLCDALDEEGPPAFDHFVGVICADGLATYDRVAEDHRYLRLGCWVHARRGFHQRKDCEQAVPILELMTQLFRIEKAAAKQADKASLAPVERAALVLEARREQSRPILRQIKELADTYDRELPDDHELRPPLTYLLNQWPTLIRYTWDGRFPMENNAAERAIRPVVIGRKNWLFIGSEDAGAWAATNYTILESCRMNRMDPRAYLNHVTQAIHAGSNDFIDLTPASLAQRFPRRKRRS